MEEVSSLRLICSMIIHKFKFYDGKDNFSKFKNLIEGTGYVKNKTF